MLVPRPLIVDGRTWGTVYTFEKAGDVFAEHVHTDLDNHITMILFGAIRCTGHPRHEGKVVAAVAGGTIIKWKAGEPHGFVAMVDGTTIANLPINRP